VGAKIAVSRISAPPAAKNCPNQSSVRSAIRSARFELGVALVLVRSAGGMARSGFSVLMADRYSNTERF
jgi:hypothetical protein